MSALVPTPSDDPHAPLLAVGLMSGTSADGIDAAAVQITGRDGGLDVRLLAFDTVPYPDSVREALFRCFRDEATVREVCVLNAVLGELFADAAEDVARRAGGSLPLAFVASHGQTVWHQPEACGVAQLGAPESGPFGRGTLQLGEAARIAERLGVPVVCDFRQQDLALGGQGAPLVPYVDYLLFAHPAEGRAIQNLGGIGNVTYLPAGGGPEEVTAFDTGPGNALMDAATRLASDGKLTCDLDGRLAASVPPNATLLAELLAEPYFQRAPPKSTGRELFSEARVREWWDRGFRGAELVSTLTQLTVDSVAEAYRRWLGPLHTVVLGGGGARNPELVRRLSLALSPARVTTADEFGVDSDAKEAIAFAVLGWETLRGRPSNVPSATGASRLAIQGKVCRP